MHTKTKIKIISGIIALIMFWVVGTINPSFKSLAWDVLSGNKINSFSLSRPIVSGSSVPQKEWPYKVLKVVDGDTLDLEINGKSERVRLIGINTPEVVDPRKTVECFGKEASNRAKELLTGKTVYIESDGSQQNRDKYDRLLRYIYMEDGVLFNKMMIEEGFAYEYTYDAPYRYQIEFKEAQDRAQREKRGLWADNACSKN